MKKARIERNPITNLPHDWPRGIPPLWNVWSDEPLNGAGNLVACGFTRRGAERQARWLGYRPRLWLRWGDKGENRFMPLVKWWLRQFKVRRQLSHG